MGSGRGSLWPPHAGVRLGGRATRVHVSQASLWRAQDSRGLSFVLQSLWSPRLPRLQLSSPSPRRLAVSNLNPLSVSNHDHQVVLSTFSCIKPGSVANFPNGWRNPSGILLGSDDLKAGEVACSFRRPPTGYDGNLDVIFEDAKCDRWHRVSRQS